ncbi:hypothetical protein AGMMS49975_02000 [Clostridia bacterium]|nr:hypothetical protein AGMMS49975_02000 [Clostridia bacterium]
MKRIRVSLCMIVKNEERCIERCISSVKPIVNEIIVVDTGSTDRTVEIAESLGAKVYYYEWDKNFANARNYAMKKAKGDWIIPLDADEWFEDLEQAKKLLKYIHIFNDNKQFHAICVRIKSIDQKNPSVVTYATVMRAYKNHRGIKYERAIHELINLPHRNHAYNEGDFVTLMHDGYSEEKNFEKGKRNLELLLGQLEEGTYDHTIHYQIGMSYKQMKQPEKAYDSFMTLVKNADGTKKMLEIPGFAIACELASGLRKPDAEIDFIMERGLELYADAPNIHFMCGLVYHDRCEYERALYHFEHMFELQSLLGEDNQGIQLRNEENDKKGSCLWIGRIYQTVGYLDKAVEYFEKGIGIGEESEKTNYQARNTEHLIRIISRRDPKELITRLNDCFPQMDKKTLERILPIMRRNAPGQGFLYFWEKWYALTKENDINLLVALALLGEWEKAYEGYLSRYNQNPNDIYKIMISSLCLAAGDKLAHSDFIAKPENADYSKIVIQALTTYGNNKNVLDAVYKMPDAGAVFSAGNTLYDMCFFAEARDVLIKSTEFPGTNASKLASCNDKIGVCSFLTGDFDSAKTYFENAKKLGMKENNFKIFYKLMNGEKLEALRV